MELLGASLPAAALYFWCRNSPLETMIPGVLQGPALSVRALLYANYNRPADETDDALSELERRGLVITDEGGVAPALYVPHKLAEPCSAPTTKNQVPGWATQIRRLGATRERVQRDSLDVTARADEQRSVGRKDVREPIYERLKRALGVGLYALPHESPDPQLSLPFAAPRPEVRLVKNEEPVEQGAFIDYLDACLEKGVPNAQAVDTKTAALGAVAAQDRLAARSIRVLADVDARGAGARAHHERLPREGVLPQGQRQATGHAQAGGSGVSTGVRAGATSEADSRAQLERFIEKSRDATSIARLLIGPDGVDIAAVYLFQEAVERVKATQADLDAMAALLASGEAWPSRGMNLQHCKKGIWLDARDHFAELLTQARTPARKPQARAKLHPVAQALFDGISDEVREEKRAANGRE